jgi:hypothetical protein
MHQSHLPFGRADHPPRRQRSRSGRRSHWIASSPGQAAFQQPRTVVIACYHTQSFFLKTRQLGLIQTAGGISLRKFLKTRFDIHKPSIDRRVPKDLLN